MFTGLVEGTARVDGWEPLQRERSAAGKRLWLRDFPFDRQQLELGESVAVNGCCLTVAVREQQRVGFDLLAESLTVTNLAAMRAGALVNVERAVALGTRLGGHLVQGHVDGQVLVREWAEREGGDWSLVVELAREDLAQVLGRGSITLDGISLTAARVDDAEATVTVFVIAHTRELTRLAELAVGQKMNVEYDLVGKFVRRQVELEGGSGGRADG